MTPYITYETAKKLSEFLGESAPKAIGGKYWATINGEQQRRNIYMGHLGIASYPAYRLEDLLSRKFCVTFAIKIKDVLFSNPDILMEELVAKYYYSGGLPAVEAALIQMMEAQ